MLKYMTSDESEAKIHNSSKEKLFLEKYFFKQSYLNRKVALNGDF